MSATGAGYGGIARSAAEAEGQSRDVVHRSDDVTASSADGGERDDDGAVPDRHAHKLGFARPEELVLFVFPLASRTPPGRHRLARVEEPVKVVGHGPAPKVVNMPTPPGPPGPPPGAPRSPRDLRRRRPGAAAGPAPLDEFAKVGKRSRRVPFVHRFLLLLLVFFPLLLLLLLGLRGGACAARDDRVREPPDGVPLSEKLLHQETEVRRQRLVVAHQSTGTPFMPRAPASCLGRSVRSLGRRHGRRDPSERLEGLERPLSSAADGARPSSFEARRVLALGLNPFSPSPRKSHSSFWSAT